MRKLENGETAEKRVQLRLSDRQYAGVKALAAYKTAKGKKVFNFSSVIRELIDERLEKYREKLERMAGV